MQAQGYNGIWRQYGHMKTIFLKSGMYGWLGWLGWADLGTGSTVESDLGGLAWPGHLPAGSAGQMLPATVKKWPLATGSK